MNTKPTILVVEDDRFLISAMRVKLTKTGYDVISATDGLEALEVLKTTTPNLILMDLVMPNLDGFGTLEKIKANQLLSNVPILITSNLGQKEDKDRVMAMGANGYLVKSDVTMDQVVETIKSMLK